MIRGDQEPASRAADLDSSRSVRAASLAVLAATAVAAIAACRSAPPGPASPGARSHPGESDPREIFPHVRLDASRKIVEIDATVPIRLDDPEAPNVYLEQVACTPDTREHEVLLVTRARPSHVHAALLLLGLEPGAPASWRKEGDRLVAVPPRGDAVSVELVFLRPDGTPAAAHPVEWIIHKHTRMHPPRVNWIFAGSMSIRRDGRESYAADGEGTLIGLASFGSEVLAWPTVISPESSVDEPVWIADERSVPAMHTPVVIRLRPAPRAP